MQWRSAVISLGYAFVAYLPVFVGAFAVAMAEERAAQTWEDGLGAGILIGYATLYGFLWAPFGFWACRTGSRRIREGRTLAGMGAAGGIALVGFVAWPLLGTVLTLGAAWPILALAAGATAPSWLTAGILVRWVPALEARWDAQATGRTFRSPSDPEHEP